MELHLFCHGEVQSLMLSIPFIGVGFYKIRNAYRKWRNRGAAT